MARYIDADKGLISKIQRKTQCNFITANSIVEEMKAEDVAPVIHAEWIERDDGWGDIYYDCSACNESWTTIEGTPFDNSMKYCPHCGAKMDKGDLE